MTAPTRARSPLLDYVTVIVGLAVAMTALVAMLALCVLVWRPPPAPAPAPVEPLTPCFEDTDPDPYSAPWRGS
jgi:hypothetical protein